MSYEDLPPRKQVLSGDRLDHTIVYNFHDVIWEFITRQTEDYKTLVADKMIIDGKPVLPWTPKPEGTHESNFYIDYHFLREVETLIEYLKPGGDMDWELQQLKPKARQLTGDNIRREIGYSR